MWRRVRQFCKGLFPKVDERDRQLVSRYCPSPLHMLFYQMDPMDQRHCLDVARDVSVSGRLAALGTSLEELTQAALLHDVGKIRGDFSLINRVILTLCDEQRLEQLALSGGFLANSAQVHLIHPQRGAHMAQLFGAKAKVVHLIRWHHHVGLAADDQLLGLLQAADEAN